MSGNMLNAILTPNELLNPHALIVPATGFDDKAQNDSHYERLKQFFS
jgi:hypothetical protein